MKKIDKSVYPYAAILMFVLILAVNGKFSDKNYAEKAASSIGNFMEDRTEINGTFILKDSIPTVDSSVGMK